jgi:hypothetical protein
MQFDFDSLRGADRGVDDAISAIDTALTAHQQRIASFGAPWGTDELGSVIGEIYQSAVAMTINCYQSNLDEMDDYASLLSEVADTFDTGSRSAAAQLNAAIGDV